MRTIRPTRVLGIFILVATLLLLLAACGSGETGATAPAEKPAAAVGSEDEPTATTEGDNPDVTTVPSDDPIPTPTDGPEASEEASATLSRLVGGGKVKSGFVSVSAGSNHTCGMRTNGAVECWGRGRDGQATPPEGEFASVSAGRYHTCGVRADGSVACWGRNVDDGDLKPPDGEFASVSAGYDYACGVMIDGAVAYWGDDDDGKATPP